MKRLIFLALVCALATGSALANPTFGDGGAALQGVLDGITTNPAGNSSIDVTTDEIPDGLDKYWAIDGSGGAVHTVVIQLASADDQDAFGVYDPTDSSKMVQVFDGADATGTQATLGIDILGNVYLGGAPTGVQFGVTYFGYYVDVAAGTWYSDTVLNGDSADHMLAYRGTGDEIQIGTWAPGEWTENMYALAFEGSDGSNGWETDQPDYADFVVMVESVTPVVPAPGALLLGSLGMGLVGWFRSRRTLA